MRKSEWGNRNSEVGMRNAECGKKKGIGHRAESREHGESGYGTGWSSVELVDLIESNGELGNRLTL